MLGPGDLRKQVCLGHKTLHYAKFWAQNATKTGAGNIPESLSNLFLRDNCRLLQRLLNNANSSPLTLQPLLFFFRFPCFFCLFSDFPCFFVLCAFFLPFPRFLGVPRKSHFGALKKKKAKSQSACPKSSITQKGVHTNRLTARGRANTGFWQHFIATSSCGFSGGINSVNAPSVRYFSS